MIFKKIEMMSSALENDYFPGKRPDQPISPVNIQGSFDGIHRGMACGWLWSPELPCHALRFAIVVEGKVVTEGIADAYRVDLATAGIGDGRHAFAVPVPSLVDQSEIQIRIFDQGHRRLESEEERQSCSSQALDRADKFILTYYPDYTATNPYQFLLAASLPDDFLAAPGTIEDALESVLRNQLERVKQHVFHLHWTTPIIASAKNEWDAIRRKELFLAKLRSFIGMGGLVIWTVHNTLSHDRKFPAVERNLCEQLARLAAYIHVHSKAVVDAVRAEYLLPTDKVKVIPHPNYVDVYPNEISQAEARDRLGIPSGHFVYAFIGQLRPYKGIQELLDAFSTIVAKNPNSHLLIAGRPVAPYESDTVSRLAASLPNTTIVERHVPDDELQYFFNASDVVVLPYKDVLTSGSVLNALSFACPVVAPSLGMIPEVVKDGINGFLYEGAVPTGLAVAMTRAFEARTDIPGFAKKALESVRAHTWSNLGSALGNSIREAATTHHVQLDVDGISRIVTASRMPGPNGRQARVAIIIVAFGNLDDIERLINSIEASACRDIEIFLVDNNSPQDPSFQELMAFKPVSGLSFTWIKTHHNLGYAGGNNVGVKFCSAQDFEYIWLLNPDTEISPKALDHLIEAAERYPDASVFGSAIYYGSDKRKIQSAGGRLRFSLGLDASHRFNGQGKEALPATPYLADYITGASLFCRTSLFSKGNYIPEKYFLYFEETHWCLQLRQLGVGLLVVPAAEVYHHKRSESNGLPEPYYLYYYIRNALLFTEHFFPEATRATSLKIKQNFIDPWIKKIQQKAPNKLPYYEGLVAKAIKDAKGHVYGEQQIDFLSANLPASLGKRRFEGFFDSVINGHINGWLFDNEEASGPVEAYIELDGSVAAVIPAQNFRADLRDAGYGDGNHGFSLPLPESLCDGRAHRIVIRAPDGTEIGNRKAAALPISTAKGRIDGIGGYHLEGWAYNPTYISEKVAIEVLADESVVASGVADRYRADLEAASIGRGHHGFSVRLPLHVLDGREHKFTIRSAADATVLFERIILAEKPVPDIPEDTLYQQQQWMYLNRECRYNRNSALLRYFSIVAATLSARYRERPQDALVSVVMPAFNREETIERSIVSVLAQTYFNFELIIVDDGSSDATVQVVQEVIERAADTRIKLVQLPTNRGVSAARNAGLSASLGEVIAYLDSDNDWNEDYLLVMANVIQETGASSAYCGQSVWHCPNGREEPVMVRAGDFWLPLLENRNYIDLNCFIHTRRVYRDCGGFNEDMRRLVDWELIVRYARHEALRYVPVLLSRYFMGRAQNQITQIEKYDQNLSKMRETISANGGKNYRAPDCVADSLSIAVVIPVLEMTDTANLRKSLSSVLYPKATEGIHLFTTDETEEYVRELIGEFNGQVTHQKSPSKSDAWRAITEFARMSDPEGAIAIMSPTAASPKNALQKMLRVLNQYEEVGAVIPQELGKVAMSEVKTNAPFATGAMAMDSEKRKMLSPCFDRNGHLFYAHRLSKLMTIFRTSVVCVELGEYDYDIDVVLETFRAMISVSGKVSLKCDLARIQNMSGA